MINTLNEALEAGNPQSVMQDIFDALIVYTMTHFTYEEKLFEKHQYARDQQHRDEHRNLTTQIKKLQQKMNQGDFMISIEVMAFLKDWLDNHILKSDMAYADYLIQHGVK